MKLTTAVLVFFSAIACSAQINQTSQLKILPAPKEVKLGNGKFVVRSTTTILINEPEDRTAAETLQEEIRERTGMKLAIAKVSEGPKTPGHISLGRLTDRGPRGYLDSQHIEMEKDLGEEGYVVQVRESGVLVAGNTGQGVFYGVQSLRQLFHADGKSLAATALVIRDWPSMRWRGVHDDISRGPIPTLAYMKKEVRTLAEYKINLLGLYIEHVFDYQTQSLAAPKEAALTPAELKELIDYAKNYYVTILPEQQAFGHLHHLLKYEIYSDLAETPHGHVLTPTNPKTYEFIRQLYGEIVPIFPGPFFHIGSDETFELGQGRTKALADQEGLGRVYLEHLQKVFEIMKPYDKQLMFWGDIAVKYPELLNILPKDMIAVPWDYDPKPSYENIVVPYRNASLRVVVAPGVNNWNQIWPNFEAGYVNIRNFIRDGQKNGAIGTLNTTWDDDGETLFDMTWPGLVFGAAASWQPGESSIEEFSSSYDWAFYRNEDRTFGEAINQLNRPHVLLASAGIQPSTDDLFWSDPFTEGGASLAAKAMPISHEFRTSVEQALASLLRNRGRAALHPETVDDMIFAAWRFDALGMKFQYTAEINRFYWDAYLNQSDAERVSRDFEEITAINARLEDLRDSTTRLRKMYEEAWQRENRPYWLGNVLVRYDNLASEMQSKIVAMRQARTQYDTTKALPAPQDMGLYMWRQ